MKRTFLFAVLAVAVTVFVPLQAISQVNPEARPTSTQTGSGYKYLVYGGFAYTSLNQVNLSRYGLMGGKVALTRNYGKYFGLTGTGDYFKPALGSGNPGNPSVYTFMVAPELHGTLYENIEGLVFGELGGEHTGGEGITPSISFAGGFGGGLQYDLGSRWAVRAVGDRVAGSFSLTNNTSQLAYSTHRSWNARATIGVVYRF